ncbi:YcfL family protein [Metapseudomonas otitidis]|uniref:YcfL family protein n=1 Tax=Metapseudomonas otitidis TaxID=319939 RepID=UPI001F43173C|nr:YcfL family protein [Pseudomonas otitidis]
MRTLLIAGLTLALLTGCSHETASSKLTPMGEVEDIEVDTMRVARENGFLTVKVKLVNTHKQNRTLYYRFAWLDKDGFPVAGEEAWKALPLYGSQTTYLPAIAPVPQATDFRLEMNTPD